VRDGFGEWTGWSINSNGGVWHKLGFSSGCSANQGITTGAEAEEVSYSDPGVYRVGVKVIDGSGNIRYGVDSVVVNLPNASFTLDESRCISNANDFQSSNLSGNVVSYSWDFDEDGLEDSNEANPTYQFPVAGTYVVTLTVENTLGCTNSSQQTITIYDEPPLPVFEVTGQLCSQSELYFQSTTDTTSYPVGVLAYTWDLSGEEEETGLDGHYTFSTPGTKVIRLTLSIPGCSRVTEQSYEVLEGLVVGFNYTNNCGSGEAVSFINTTTGPDITRYSWDFGDGATSSELNASHVFGVTGQYDVFLEMENANGCVHELTQALSVTDAARANFQYRGSLPSSLVYFEGQDLTPADDEVTSWSWQIGGVTQSTAQSTEYTFNSAGQSDVRLIYETEQGCDSEVLRTLTTCDPLPITFARDSICLNESVSISHSISGGVSYEWDYCVGDFDSTMTQFQIADNAVPGVTGLSNLTLVESMGNWYGFMTGRNNGILYRLEFGSDIGSNPMITSMGNVGGLLSTPERMELIEEGGLWYGLLVNAGNSHLVRLVFADGLTSPPTVEDLGDLGVLNGPRGISLTADDGSYVAVITNFDNELTMVDFGSSMSNSIDLSTDVLHSTLPTGTGGITSVDIVKQCDSYYGLVSGWNTTRLYHLSFGNQLFSEPLISDLSGTIGAVNQGGRVRFLAEGGAYYGFVLTLGGSVIKLSFGEDPSSLTPVRETAIQLSSANTTYSLDLVRDGFGEWTGWSINSNGGVWHKVGFSSGCSANQGITTGAEAEEVSYSGPGVYRVGVKVTDGSGNIRYGVDSVVVNLPNASFTLDESRCISNANDFQSSNLSGNVVSY
ncbi:MAG: PKD domain-containing protein, partial [Marinoscillum sp.]